MAGTQKVRVRIADGRHIDVHPAIQQRWPDEYKLVPPPKTSSSKSTSKRSTIPRKGTATAPAPKPAAAPKEA